jgi:hypothetical protein
MQIEVSNGEIVDKLTILEIKLQYITDEHKRNNLLNEYKLLDAVVANILDKESVLYKQLYEVNLALWHIEDACREHEKNKLFNEDFIAIARSVYTTNDERAAIKKEINIVTNSTLIEEKSYQ